MRVVIIAFLILALIAVGQVTGVLPLVERADAKFRGGGSISRSVTRTSSATKVTPVKPRTMLPAKPSHKTAYKSSSGSWLPIAAVLMVMSSDGVARQVEADTPMLTMCTAEQAQQAYNWQETCDEADLVQEMYCPILSYFRYCEPATPEDVQGLRPLKDAYRNVYLKE